MLLWEVTFKSLVSWANQKNKPCRMNRNQEHGEKVTREGGNGMGRKKPWIPGTKALDVKRKGYMDDLWRLELFVDSGEKGPHLFVPQYHHTTYRKPC